MARPGFGQCGAGGAGAGKQADPQLALQIGDGIADHRSGAAQLAGGGGETAGLHNRQKDRDLVQGGGFGLHCSIFSNISGRNYPSFQNKARRPSSVCTSIRRFHGRSPKILIPFYSRTGTIERLAKAVAEGAEAEGAEVRLRRARELVGADVMAQVPGWKERPRP